MQRLTLPCLALLVGSVACAPLVSKRKAAPAAVAPVVVRAEPRPTPAPPPPPAPPPVVVAEAPAKVVEVARAEPAPEPPPPPPPKKKERTSYYSFTEEEVATLKRRSREFQKVWKQHAVCTEKSEKAIARRGEVRDQIIELQNKEGRTTREDRKLASLRLEERAMKLDKAENGAQCQPLEQRLTEMLRETFGATASAETY